MFSGFCTYDFRGCLCCGFLIFWGKGLFSEGVFRGVLVGGLCDACVYVWVCGYAYVCVWPWMGEWVSGEVGLCEVFVVGGLCVYVWVCVLVLWVLCVGLWVCCACLSCLLRRIEAPLNCFFVLKV